MSQFYCCKHFQDYDTYKDVKTDKKYEIGKCFKCQKTHLMDGDKEITGRAAKRIIEKYKSQLRRKKSYEGKYISRSCYGLRHFASRRLTRCLKDTKEINDYQVECYADGTVATAPDYSILKKTQLKLISTIPFKRKPAKRKKAS